MPVTISATSGAQTSTETCPCCPSACPDRIDKNLEWSTTLSYPGSNCTGNPSYDSYNGFICAVLYGPFVRYFENETHVYYAGASGSSYGMQWQVIDGEQVGFYYPGDANTRPRDNGTFSTEIVLACSKSTREITCSGYSPSGQCRALSDGTSRKQFWRLV